MNSLQTLTTSFEITEINYKNALRVLSVGISGWLSGLTLREIETSMGGVLSGKGLLCPKSREIATEIAPRSLSFFSTFVVQIVKQLEVEKGWEIPYAASLECLPTAISRGFDRPEKLVFFNLNKTPYLSRVDSHKQFYEKYPELTFDLHYNYEMIVQAMSTKE